MCRTYSLQVQTAFANAEDRLRHAPCTGRSLRSAAMHATGRPGLSRASGRSATDTNVASHAGGLAPAPPSSRSVAIRFPISPYARANRSRFRQGVDWARLPLPSTNGDKKSHPYATCILRRGRVVLCWDDQIRVTPAPARAWRPDKNAPCDKIVELVDQVHEAARVRTAACLVSPSCALPVLRRSNRSCATMRSSLGCNGRTMIVLSMAFSSVLRSAVPGPKNVLPLSGLTEAAPSSRNSCSPHPSMPPPSRLVKKAGIAPAEPVDDEMAIIHLLQHVHRRDWQADYERLDKARGRPDVPCVLVPQVWQDDFARVRPSAECFECEVDMRDNDVVLGGWGRKGRRRRRPRS